MTISSHFFIYLLITSGVTYLVRMIPLAAIKKKIHNRFILSFLHYIPYSILTIMTVPAIFYATGNGTSALVGFCVALFFSFKEKSLVLVSGASCLAVLLTEIIQNYI